MKLLSVEDARAAMLADADLLGTEMVDLLQATGRVLAEDVIAVRDQPPFDASAMDGWAVRSTDLPAPHGLRIVGEAAAGKALTISVGPNEAARISTGAPVPVGADRIVIQEEAKRDGETVRIEGLGGDWIRPRGGDFRAGEVLLRKGLRIDPWQLAMAGAAGRAGLSVARRPKVAVIASGDELARAGSEAAADAIYDSAGPAIAALAAAWGAEAHRPDALGDDEDDVTERLRSIEGDLLVTIGGASVGDHDVLRAAAGRLGLEMRVESVRVRPGKPTWFGQFADGRLLLGLPGNPASSLVCAELFLRPLMSKLQGGSAEFRTRPVRLATALGPAGPREHWMRARLRWTDDGVEATPFTKQDSSLVTVFAGSDCLIRRRAGEPASEAGAVAQAIILDRFIASNGFN